MNTDWRYLEANGSRELCVLAVNEKLRYSQLRKEMYNITDAVLVATLKDLVEDGIAERKSYNSTNRMGWRQASWTYKGTR